MMVSLMILAFLIAWLPYAVLALAVQYFYVSIPNHEKFNVRKVSLRADLINLSVMPNYKSTRLDDFLYTRKMSK